MNKYIRRSLVVVLGSLSALVSANPGPVWDLSVVNNGGETVLIQYQRSPQGPMLSKLLEYKEALSFGKVSGATLMGSGMLAPKSITLIPPQHDASEKMVLNIKVKSSGISHMFIGEWDIEKIAVLPHVVLPKPDMVLDAFPTVMKKLVPTPRFILGLPEDASVAAANDASQILTNKWHAVVPKNAAEQVLINKILRLIDDSRVAFEQERPDQPLRDVVSKGIRELTTD